MSFQVIQLRPLRSGGNGDLFIGRRTDTAEDVVVKFLRDFHLADARRRFAREVRVLRRKLRHVVQILMADTVGPRPYYVMPYFPAGSLTCHAGRLTEAQLQTVAWELGVALADFHAEWVSHGDVKPDNILLSHDGHLQVADPLGNGLGCTVLFWDNHGGTPGYWAPEICSGGTISRPGDVYSYGATLHHLMTGVAPQDGQSLGNSLERWVRSPVLRDVVSACCQQDPDARPSMQEVLRILRGQTWAKIRAEKKARQDAVGALVAGSVIALGVVALVNMAEPAA
jgi:serine/threonine protein kinase